MPPTSSFYYLPDTGVVVPSSNIKLEVIGALLRRCVTVFLVEDFVQLLHKLYVDKTVKFRFF